MTFQPAAGALGDARARTVVEALGPNQRTLEDVVTKRRGSQGSPKRLTPARRRKRERCVKEQKAKGSSVSRAFAICTASVTGTTKRRRRS